MGKGGSVRLGRAAGRQQRLETEELWGPRPFRGTAFVFLHRGCEGPGGLQWHTWPMDQLCLMAKPEPGNERQSGAGKGKPLLLRLGVAASYTIFPLLSPEDHQVCPGRKGQLRS